jgi:hypothetical protein
LNLLGLPGRLSYEAIFDGKSFRRGRESSVLAHGPSPAIAMLSG